MTSTSSREDRTSKGATATLNRTALELFSEFQRCARDDDAAGFRRILAPDFRLTMPGTINGDADQAIEVFRGWNAAFADYGQNQGNLTDFSSADGSQLSVRDSHTMTHTGQFQLSDGTIMEPDHANPRSVTIYTQWTILAGDDGIRRIDATYDTLSLWHQLQGHDIRHGQPISRSSRPTR